MALTLAECVAILYNFMYEYNILVKLFKSNVKTRAQKSSDRFIIVIMINLEIKCLNVTHCISIVLLLTRQVVLS